MKHNHQRQKRKPRLFLSLLSLGAGLAIAISAGGKANRDYSFARINGHFAHVVKIDLRDSKVSIQPAVAPSGGLEFMDFINKWKPSAAINGGFFDADFHPLGDVLCGGKLLAKGSQRTAIGVTKSGAVEFRHRSGRAPFRWNGYSAGIAAGPMLVRQGKVSVNPEADGFRPASRKVRAPRSAVGITANKELLLVAVQELVTLEEMARVMSKLRATEAMNLDGGRSCALYADGDVVVSPSSRLCTVLMVRQKPKR